MSSISLNVSVKGYFFIVGAFRNAFGSVLEHGIQNASQTLSEACRGVSNVLGV